MNDVLQNPSVAEIPEGAFVERLLGDPHWRSSLLAIRGIPAEAVWKQQVPLSGLPGSPPPRGDIDILLWAPARPNEAVAVEVKRFKARVGGTADSRLNNLSEYAKGVRQANTLARIGFSQVYLWVFVLVDSRKQNARQITYAGLTSSLSSQVEQAISTDGLDASVGLIHYEFVQPMDYEPLVVGTSGGHLVRPAHVQCQPNEVTAWVASR